MKRPNYFNIAIITFIIIAVAAVGYYGYSRTYGNSLQTYANSQYGVTFTYPNNYTLEENRASGTQSGTVVVLTDKKVAIPSNGEAPVSMTIGMYSSSTLPSSGVDPLLSWIQASPSSNFSQALQAPQSTLVAAQPAYLYTWDGLYNGTTVATLHNGNIIIFTVTYDGNSDMQIRQDFTDLVGSVRFTDTSSTAAANH